MSVALNRQGTKNTKRTLSRRPLSVMAGHLSFAAPCAAIICGNLRNLRIDLSSFFAREARYQSFLAMKGRRRASISWCPWCLGG
jgi:hypothetical protein